MGLISNISKGRGLGGATRYVLNKEGAERLLTGNMTGEDADELIREFGARRRLRPDIERACFHAALSTDQELNEIQWEEACERYVAALGYDKSQWFAVRHSDTDNDHVHIVANAINSELERVSDSRDYYKAQDICAELEKDFGLDAAVQERPRGMRSQTRYEWQLEQDGDVPIKQDLQERVGSAIDAAVARGGSMECLVEELDQRSVDLKVRRDSEGIPRGAIFARRRDGEAMSGSSLARNWSWGKLQSEEGLSYEAERDDRALDESTHRAEHAIDVGGFGTDDPELEQTTDGSWTAPTHQDPELVVEMDQVASGFVADTTMEVELEAAELEQADDDPWATPAHHDYGATHQPDSITAEPELEPGQDEVEVPTFGGEPDPAKEHTVEPAELEQADDDPWATPAHHDYVATHQPDSITAEPDLEPEPDVEPEQVLEPEPAVAEPLPLTDKGELLEQLRAKYEEQDRACVHEGQVGGRIAVSEVFGEERLVVFVNEEEWSWIMRPTSERGEDGQAVDYAVGGYLRVDYDKHLALHDPAVDMLAGKRAVELESYMSGEGLRMASKGRMDGYVAWTEKVSTTAYGHSEEAAKERGLAMVVDKEGERFAVVCMSAEHASVLEQGGEMSLEFNDGVSEIKSYSPPEQAGTWERVMRVVQKIKTVQHKMYTRRDISYCRSAPAMQGGGFHIQIGESEEELNRRMKKALAQSIADFFAAFFPDRERDSGRGR